MVKTTKNKTVGGARLEYGTLRDVRTVGSKHISVHLRGSFAASTIDSDKFGTIMLDGGINLSMANPKMITPPSGYELVKRPVPEADDAKWDEFFDNLLKED